MVTPTLTLLRDELQEFLRPQIASNSCEVKVCKLVSRDGKVSLSKDKHQVIITLMNIQEERNMHQSRTSNPGHPYCFNLTLLFSIYEKEEEVLSEEAYLEAMMLLDGVLQFFQQNSNFTTHSHPHLPDGIQHLQFELASEDLRENSYLWTMTGAKHTPSVLYKVRSVTVGHQIPQLTSTTLAGNQRIDGFNF